MYISEACLIMFCLVYKVYVQGRKDLREICLVSWADVKSHSLEPCLSCSIDTVTALNVPK